MSVKTSQLIAIFLVLTTVSGGFMDRLSNREWRPKNFVEEPNSAQMDMISEINYNLCNNLFSLKEVNECRRKAFAEAHLNDFFRELTFEEATREGITIQTRFKPTPVPVPVQEILGGVDWNEIHSGYAGEFVSECEENSSSIKNLNERNAARRECYERNGVSSYYHDLFKRKAVFLVENKTNVLFEEVEESSVTDHIPEFYGSDYAFECENASRSVKDIDERNELRRECYEEYNVISFFKLIKKPASQAKTYVQNGLSSHQALKKAVCDFEEKSQLKNGSSYVKVLANKIDCYRREGIEHLLSRETEKPVSRKWLPTNEPIHENNMDELKKEMCDSIARRLLGLAQDKEDARFECYVRNEIVHLYEN